MSLPGPLAHLAPLLKDRRRLLQVGGAALGLLLILFLILRAVEGPRQSRGGGGLTHVGAADVEKGDMRIEVAGLGTVTSLATVTVQSQISGQIVAIKFTEGEMVKRGAPLIEIDPRPFQVALEQAQGALARDEALLNNARLDLKRYQTLFEQDSIAEQQLATQRALVVQDEGTLKTDRAAIDAAKLNLVYCHIISPVEGLAGLQQVNLGNYVTPAMPNGLVVVTELQPITVVFTVPEDRVPEVLQQLHDRHGLEVKAWDRSHQTLLATGTMSTVDSQIDPSTGTLKLKAHFANTDRRLFPNQFVNVDLLLSTLHDVVLVPKEAVLIGAPGTYVYVVGADHKVSVRKVTLGPGDPARTSVTAGLSAGERVVVDGTDRLQEGMEVVVHRSAEPEAAPAGAPPAPAPGGGQAPKEAPQEAPQATAGVSAGALRPQTP